MVEVKALQQQKLQQVLQVVLCFAGLIAVLLRFAVFVVVLCWLSCPWWCLHPCPIEQRTHPISFHVVHHCGLSVTVLPANNSSLCVKPNVAFALESGLVAHAPI